ncbi:MAG: hypothetical protein ACYTGX_14330, partial [Planctomycetota bacterium]
TGAIYVWAGGTGLTGAVAPTATLTVTGAVASDRLGNAPAQGIQCCDVTGDGVLDVVAGAQFADVGGTVDTGAIYVWAGGTGLTGAVAPTATLTVTGAVASDRLGNARSMWWREPAWPTWAGPPTPARSTYGPGAAAPSPACPAC